MHGGLFGLILRALGRASSHIWFDRSEVKDRLLVAQR
jgi:glycerol-3-phosphate O-acyltransferase 3/4